MTGPFILITLGVLFLLNNLYPGQFGFGRMWPVILIVIGLVKIFEYLGRPGRQSPDDHSSHRHPERMADRVAREPAGDTEERR